jgi:hypothetical protein
MTEPALESDFEGYPRKVGVVLAQRRIEVTPLGALVVQREVDSVLTRWEIAPGAAARDIGVIRVEHEALCQLDQIIEVRLTEAQLASIAGRPVDDSGVRSALWTRVTMLIDIARKEGHDVASWRR